MRRRTLTPLDKKVLNMREEEKQNAIRFHYSDEAKKIRELNNKSDAVIRRLDWLEKNNGDEHEIQKLERLLDEHAELETKIRRDPKTAKNTEDWKWGDGDKNKDGSKWRMLDVQFAEKQLAKHNIPMQIDPLSGFKIYNVELPKRE